MDFAAALERSILATLNGDREKPGLYQSLRVVPNWEGYLRTNSLIMAYEAVLAEMRTIARRMNGEELDEPRAPLPLRGSMN
jgi:hypothetical protein